MIREAAGDKRGAERKEREGGNPVRGGTCERRDKGRVRKARE